MKVTPGYHQTDVGVVPTDWDVKPLAFITHKIMVGIASAATHAYRNKGIPMFRNQNLKAGYLDDKDLLYIDPEYEKAFVNKRLQAGDLLIARTGYPGTACVVPEYYGSAQSFTTLIARPNGGRIDSSFLCTYINSEAGQNFFELAQIGGAQKNVNAGTLRKMPVPIPPLAEQRAIATVLSDVDALLDRLDRLITKKRDLKQAAMQQLLTGQTRLSGFSGEWEVLNMAKKSLLKARIGWQGLTTSEYLAIGKYRLVTGTDFLSGRINWETCPFVTADRYEQDRNIQLRPNDVLVTKDGTIGKVAFVDELLEPATLNSGVFVIRPKDNAYKPLFLYYILASEIFKDFLRKLAAGSTISHLYQKDFVSFEFQAPPSVDEQAAIAAVLSDMDAELAALETRRDKTRDLKQGMMQELLIGRTRLVTPGAAHA